MKTRVFIDTGFWIALFDARDEHHQKAKKNLESILTNYDLYISEYILFETITYLNCSIKNHTLALTFLDRVTSNDTIKILKVDSEIISRALEIFKKYEDQYFSFTDCTSFVIMKKESIDKYIGFDKHFTNMGFHPFPFKNQ